MKEVMDSRAEFKETLMQRARTFLNEDAEPFESMEQLATLPCWYLKEINNEISEKIKIAMAINTIEELSQVDLDQREEDIEKAGFTLNFERWVIAARIIARISRFEVSKVKNIAILGIDNAGKSAIKETLIRKYQTDPKSFLQVIGSLSPTRGVERETLLILNNELQLWDMGGQKSYRDNYLERPEKYLLNFPAIIFVIDILDDKRYDAAIAYLNTLATTFRSLNQYPVFVVCFHKFDPNLQQEEDYNNTINNLWSNISAILSENMCLHKKYTTSIYDDVALFRMFSDVTKLLVDSEVLRIINAILEEAAKEMGLKNLIMLGENGITLGEYFEDQKIATELFEQLYQISFQTITSFKRLNATLKTKRHLRNLFSSFYSVDRLNFLMTHMIVLNQSLYLAALHASKTEFDEKLVLTLMPWLSNLFI